MRTKQQGTELQKTFVCVYGYSSDEFKDATFRSGFTVQAVLQLKHSMMFTN